MNNPYGIIHAIKYIKIHNISIYVWVWMLKLKVIFIAFRRGLKLKELYKGSIISIKYLDDNKLEKDHTDTDIHWILS